MLISISSISTWRSTELKNGCLSTLPPENGLEIEGIWAALQGYTKVGYKNYPRIITEEGVYSHDNTWEVCIEYTTYGIHLLHN